MRTERFPGRALADRILTRVAARVRKLERPPTLAIVLVGRNAASEAYVAEKERRGANAGIAVLTLRFPTATKTVALMRALREINRDPAITGVIVQLPLPRALPTDRILRMVDPEKDVDGFHPENLRHIGRRPRFIPPTIAGILLALTYSGLPLPGKSVALVGKTSVFAATLSALLRSAGASVTVVPASLVRTSRILREAPFVVSLVGKPKLIRGSMLRPGAVVIDAGFTRRGKKIYGDVDERSVEGVARLLTPVPGGIGPLTVAFLLENVITAAERKQTKAGR
jgi:methylenetetrahydrofolate dehydrogenase (NADP+)/methenyltetrahydrofolate cyclohydrolase